MFSNRTHFAEIYPMVNKSDVGQALKTFVMELGVPEELMVNGLKEDSSPGTEFMKFCRRNDILLRRTKPERPNHNPAERVIREVQRQWFQTMIRRGLPRKIWDYGL